MYRARCPELTKARRRCKKACVPGKKFCAVHRQFTVRELADAPLLHSAIFDNKMRIVRLVLARGAFVNEPMGDGFTPLHVAARYGRADAVRLLLKHGARVEARDEDGETPLHLAADNNHLDVVMILLTLGNADPDAEDNDGLKPMDYADDEDVRVLLSQ